MTPARRFGSQRILPAALASVLAAFVCALVLAPASRAATTTSGGLSTHIVGIAAPHSHAVQRADVPDATVPATILTSTPPVVVESSVVTTTDSSYTVDTERTRGPPTRG
jgi:hypothetical protein